MIAIRGAIRVERNDRDVIFRGTQRLLREIERRNDLEEDDVVSAFFTMTPDLNADFPAYAAREMGWTDTAMLGAQETAVPGAMDRVVRVLVHAAAPGPARHVYLGEATAMRPDLAEEGDAAPDLPEPAREPARFGTLMVVGLGLIGGSAALALRRRGLFRRIVGHDVSREALDLAVRAGAISEAVDSVPEGLEPADVVLLAIPVRSLLRWLEEWGASLARGTVLVDVGSTKRQVVEAMEGLPEGVEAVGAHPMAGSEESGMGAARPDLFHGSNWALVETARTGSRAREVAEAVVDAVGGRPFWTEAADHDRATAATSHLPYLLASVLATHLADRAEEEPVRALVSSGAKDMTRLASSDPGIMADILATNWPEVREEVLRYRRRLDRWLERLDEGWEVRADRGSGEPLRELLEAAGEARRTLLEDGGPGPGESREKAREQRGPGASVPSERRDERSPESE